MENLTNSAEEVLIDSLSFKLPSSGQYVQDRRSCTFHTEGSNSYSATAGTKVIRFRLAGDGSWLDPSTFRIMFDVVNASDNPGVKVLRPIGKAHGFFRRLRISVRGQIIEDIDNYNRVSEMFHILQTPHSRENDAIEEFGYNANIENLGTVAQLPGIGVASQTVMFQPLCGIFQQTKYLPLRYAPLEIELELADVLDPIINIKDPFTVDNTSLLWKIENCMVKVDLCTLDNALENSYVSHFMASKTINIVYNTFISTLQTVVSADTQINVSRSLSKMKSVFVTLDKNFGTNDVRSIFCNKSWNNFWSPNAGTGMTGVLTHTGEKFSHFQLQIGSKLFPEYPIKTHCEAFYSLRKALGIQANNLHSIDIDGVEYRNNKFIVGIDTEKLLGLSFTGMNTRNNLMTVHLKTLTGDNKADRMHIILLAEQIVELGDSGCMVYD
jgi:hypothetical protein